MGGICLSPGSIDWCQKSFAHQIDRLHRGLIVRSHFSLSVILVRRWRQQPQPGAPLERSQPKYDTIVR